MGEKESVELTDPNATEDEKNKACSQWELKTKTEKIKAAPAVTQFKRRLEAPFHQLMNAISQAFPRYRGQTLKPYWKTLVLTDKEGSWLGQIQYKRTKPTQTLTAMAVSDWACYILLPEDTSQRSRRLGAKGGTTS